ncbi:MAG: 6-pyruvoyl trahydropterin synthase family protein [Planctomycetota bacterium]|jgi:6-pyruvoyltetrahydropterin/6-carboxytetrahydropterin synthase
MYTVIVETSFNASHNLTLPDGSKEKLHGHEWKIAAKVTSNKLNKMGLVIDFHRLKSLIEGIVSDINGRKLEEIEFFQKNNSSAENVAKYIYEKLGTILPKSVQLNDITVTEEPGYLAKFEK